MTPQEFFEAQQAVQELHRDFDAGLVALRAIENMSPLDVSSIPRASFSAMIGDTVRFVLAHVEATLQEQIDMDGVRTATLEAPKRRVRTRKEQMS